MEPKEVTLQSLREMTDDFSSKRLVGEGSFGVVYRGVTHAGEDVAVKMLKPNSYNTDAGIKQFKNEMYHLAMLKHQNIVQVLGYCYEIEKKSMVFNGKTVLIEETHRAICLEYLHKGSLRERLSDEFDGSDWDTRFKIIKGTCEGLKYILHDLEVPLCHFDLKPENILFDKDMTPKITDFGLSMIFGNDQKWTTQYPLGTFGYQPPEYIDSGEVTDKFDIFSFGVVMIMIMSGPKGYYKCEDMSSDEFSNQVQKNWRHRFQATFNGSLLEMYCHQVETCIQIALKCVEKDWWRRPDIVMITEKLNEIETDNCTGDLCRASIKSGRQSLRWSAKTCSPVGPADRRQSCNIGDITSGLDETKNQSVLTFASENDGDTNAGGKDEIMLFGGAETDITDQECNADDDTHDGEDNMEFGIVQPTEAMELNILERVVAGSEEPSHLDLSLLQSITENFSEQRKIGVGGCGDVYKGILRNGIVAVKRLYNSRTIKDKMFHREVQSLITVRHKNIVRFLGYCSFTEERVLIFEGRTIMADIRERLLCFEYIRNGNLENYLTDELRGLEWHTRYEIILGICKGLLYLHKDKGIVHMDLKPANILLDDLMVPKITDFGLSRLDNNSQAVTTSRLMSPRYCAPEYFLEGKSSSKSDIYSLGVMVIELVTGSKKEHDLTKVLRKWSHRWNKSSKHTPLGYQQVTRCLELAQRCIQIDPTARPDIMYIMDELNTIDSEGGQFQEIPFLDDMLGIEPLEIHFPFELDLQMSHSIELANDTNGYIAFMTKAWSHRFRIEPDKGIVPPGSKCGVIITMQAHVNALPNNHHKEITFLSTRVDGGIASMDITRDVFIEKEGTVVDEVNVMVVFDKPPSAEEES